MSGDDRGEHGPPPTVVILYSDNSDESYTARKLVDYESASCEQLPRMYFRLCSKRVNVRRACFL